MSDKIKIQLTAKEAEAFKRFREYQELFEILVEGQVFGTKSGQVILYFNADGTLMEIRREIKTFRR